MDAVTSTRNLWKDANPIPAVLAFQKNMSATASINQMIQEIFKKEAAISSLKTISESIAQHSIKSNLNFDPAIVADISSIAENQKLISSIFSKRLSRLPHTVRAQAATPAFVTAMLNVGYTNKLSMLQETLKGVSRTIAARGIIGIDKEVLQKFKQTTEEAVAISDEISETSMSALAVMEKLEVFIESNFQKFTELAKAEIDSGIKKSQKSNFALINLWLTIIGIILSIITIFQSYQAENEPTQKTGIDKVQIHELKQFVDRKFQKALCEATIQVKARVDCNLRYRPSKKSSGFFRVKAGQTAYVIESNHKWLRITIIDSTDNLPVSGWVMKKHFIREILDSTQNSTNIN